MATEFSRTLSLLRQERGVSQRTAAGDLGISQALLSHYENGLREPGLEFLANAGRYYGCSVDRLLGLESLASDAAPLSAVAAVKTVTEFAAAQGELLGEIAEDYLMLAAYRLMLLLDGGEAGALIASDAALRADELAICAAERCEAATLNEALTTLREKMAERTCAGR